MADPRFAHRSFPWQNGPMTSESADPARSPRLLLVGAGDAHLFVLEGLALGRPGAALRAGAELVTGVASGIDPAGRLVGLSDGRRLPYDVVSFAIGGVTAGLDLPGVREFAHPVKPIEAALSIGPALDRLSYWWTARPG